MSSNNYYPPQAVPYHHGAQRATYDESFENSNPDGWEQQLSVHGPARNSSQFCVDNASSRIGMPFCDSTFQRPPTVNISNHDANQADVDHFQDAQPSFFPTANYTDNFGNIVDNSLSANPHNQIPPNERQRQARPYYSRYAQPDQMYADRREVPWSHYTVVMPSENSRSPFMSTFANGPSPGSPLQQGQGGSTPRRKSVTSTKSVPPNAHSSLRLYPSNFQSLSRSSSQRLSVTEESHSTPKPSSPNRSTTSEQTGRILLCGKGSCAVRFKGLYQRGNRARHWRRKHGDGGNYPCEEPGCTKSYQRQDARLKHYRTHHSRLNPGPPLSRKLHSSM